MTENEAIKITIEDALHCEKFIYGEELCEECRLYGLCHTFCDDVHRMVVKLLEEIQQYRALEAKLNGITVEQVVNAFIEMVETGTNENYRSGRILTNEEAEIWDKYRSIGTVEECRAAVEKAYAYLSGSISNGIFTEVICKKCRSRREGEKNK